ncbi:MAG TPA: hypothetical protein VFP97_11020 [Chitinophagaceae bacterium]|nr:hypothetical protein [Chitinophagaceae bacterium]
MKLLNFNIGDDFISAVKEDLYLDLHNDFDFTGYSCDVLKKEFKLIFRKGRAEWIQNNGINNLAFKFKEVSFLKIQEGDSREYPDDERCLDGIGFNTEDMRSDMDSFLASNEFHDDYDLIFTFVSGLAIKIHSKEVFLETI